MRGSAGASALKGSYLMPFGSARVGAASLVALGMAMAWHIFMAGAGAASRSVCAKATSATAAAMIPTRPVSPVATIIHSRQTRSLGGGAGAPGSVSGGVTVTDILYLDQSFRS